MIWDAVVVGLGGVGSFCLRSLARGSRHSSKGNQPLPGSSSSTSNRCRPKKTKMPTTTNSALSSSSHQDTEAVTIPKQQRHRPQILGLEAWTRGHDKGSSHGGSRIYRRAYFEHSNYVPWIDYSIREFQKLELSTKSSLLYECGTLLIEQPSLSTSSSLIQQAYQSAQQHNIEVQHVSSTELKHKYPQFKYNTMNTEQKVDLVGLLEPGGGFVRPERAIFAALQDVERCHHYPHEEELVDDDEEDYAEITIWEQTRVVSIQEVSKSSSSFVSSVSGDVHSNNHDDNNSNDDDDTPNKEHDETIVQLIIRNSNATQDETIWARTVLVAAGAWTGTIIPCLAPFLTVTRQIQGWISVDNNNDNNSNITTTTNASNHHSEMYHPSQMPTWVMVHPKITYPIYGFPIDPDVQQKQQQQQEQQLQQGQKSQDDDDQGHVTTTAVDDYTPSSPKNWIKVGLHGRNCPVDLNHLLSSQAHQPSQSNDSSVKVVQPVVTDDEIDELQRACQQVLNLPQKQQQQHQQEHGDHIFQTMENNSFFALAKPCYYTMSPDGHFVLGVPPGYTKVACVAGLSGHGFKMTPALGQMLADFYFYKGQWNIVEQQWQAQFCSMSRFFGTSERHSS